LKTLQQAEQQMANKKYDGVIEAVHYAPDGKVDWVRAYLRRGAIWSDRVIIHRQELIDEIKSGRSVMLGKRIEFLAGTFEVSSQVKVGGAAGQEFLTTSSTADRDTLEGAPVL
jgi:hypothetical protein